MSLEMFKFVFGFFMGAVALVITAITGAEVTTVLSVLSYVILSNLLAERVLLVMLMKQKEEDKNESSDKSE